jgi:hypothetical protein
MMARRKILPKCLGSALVMTLVIVVLITVVTVGYLASVMLESKTAGASLDQEKAYGIAVIGAHEAMSRVRDALGPWDDPYKNFATDPPAFYWSLSPGRITRWSYSNLATLNFALFSESAGTQLVNLNRQLVDGSFPIIGQANSGETTPPDLSVKWVNLLRDPSKPASDANTIVGRYAFWVDDESAKININTADGTEKYTPNSLGIGSPSEVSLEVLFGGTKGRDLSKQVVEIARTNTFSSPREILRFPNVTADVYASNVFSLTAYSRSPELNVFGQPRMALVPVLGDAGFYATDMALNGITMRPIREIYPTPSQFPKYVSRQLGNSLDFKNSWPLAFRQGAALFNGGHLLGFQLDDGPDSYLSLDNYCFVNGMMLAKYLSGTNAAGAPITWPVFQGTSSGGFGGKYTPRQIDSIVAQICNLGASAVSPDYPYALKGSSGGGSFEKGFGEQPEDGASAPVLFPGWLSGQWVSGMGRSPKVTSVLLKFTTFGSSGDPQNAYTPPKASLDIWVEWWLPAAFRGSTQSGAQNAKHIHLGTRGFQNALNCIDVPEDLEWHGPPGSQPPGPPAYWYPPALLPRSDGTLTAYWSDQLLRNNQGIDFSGSPPNRHDPDQTRAMAYHDPYARANPVDTNGPWMGTGSLPNDLSSPFEMLPMTSTDAWLPGQIRCVQNQYGGHNGLRMPMSTNASGSTLQIEGGVAVLAQMLSGYYSEADPVPLEATRGPRSRTREDYASHANSPGDPSETLRDRVLASVIPVNVSIPVPPHNSVDESVKYVLAKVTDPLVNKFPGDWKASESVAAPSSTMKYLEKAPSSFNSYDENDSWRGDMSDPDSYWMPQIDCALYIGQTPLIPRSARLPNVGYLQYVRTGIIPDDEENVPYASQEGTPFRLLSFAPSTETANQKTARLSGHPLGASQPYPDWALLDLLYVPSTLTPNGGPYGASPNLDFYGTFGGATSGRINPNGAVIYTTDVDVPQPKVSRTLPMQAVLRGLKVNQKILGAGTNVSWSPGTDVDFEKIAQEIESYIRANGPLRMPGELCNVTEIANLRPSVNPTRNDLIRQIAGSLTTQGNVFSVWSVGQAILKNRNNSGHGEFQSGDTVLAEVRVHFVVERYLDPGADGIYGNSGNPGNDAIVGTYDDPEDPANHPFQPRYLYRVIASEEIR